MKKVIIIGLTGSGKTTLALQLSTIFGLPIFYLDQIFWKEKGHIKDADFVAQQEEIMKLNDIWILDGGFPRSKSLDVRISYADTIIFYDLPLYLVFWRQLKRYIEYRNKIRPDFGRTQPFPFTWKDIMYSIHYPRKEIYAKILAYEDSKKVVVIRNNKEQNAFLKTLQN